MTSMARQAVRSAPEGADRVDFTTAEGSPLGSVSVPKETRAELMSSLRSICAGGIEHEAEKEPDVELCRHRERDYDTNEVWGCRLHLGHKGKCQRGERIEE